MHDKPKDDEVPIDAETQKKLSSFFDQCCDACGKHVPSEGHLGACPKKPRDR